MKLIVLLFAFSVLGCATGYQPEGFSGGYDEQKVGDNKYLVSFSGNGFTSGSEVQRGAFRRAEELCMEKNYNSFEMISKDGSTSQSTTPTTVSCYGNSCSSQGGITFNKHSVEILIQCTHPAQQAAQETR